MRRSITASMLCGLLCASVASAQTSVSQEFLTASEDEGHRTEISISADLMCQNTVKSRVQKALKTDLDTISVSE